MTDETLWGGGVKIPVLGVTGEKWSGKTLFLSQIDPAGTLMVDLEKSSETYASSIPYKRRVDLYDELVKRQAGCNAIDSFIWFRETVEAAEDNEYSVIAVDPINDIEQGLVDWVKQNPGDFGKTAAQYDRGGGLLWGDVNSYWKTFLGILSAKCQCFAFSTHMGFVWKGSAPTSQRKAKGKATLFELSSLYLHLQRNKKSDGSMPPVPSAVILKDRLSRIEFKDGVMQVQPILPPRLNEATPNAIRNYIAKPADYAKLKKAEKAPERVMTDDERLETESQIAADKRGAAEAELAAASLKMSATEKMVATAKAKMESDKAKAEAPSSQPAEKQSEPDAEPEKGKDAWEMCDFLRRKLNIGDTVWQNVLNTKGVVNLKDLPLEQAIELSHKLKGKLDAASEGTDQQYMTKN